MNKIRFSALPAVVILLLLFNSCKEKSLTFETVELQDSLCLVSGADSVQKNCCRADIVFEYPATFGDTLVLKRLQQAIVVAAFDSLYINVAPVSAPAAFVTTVFADYKQFNRETANLPTPLLSNSESWQITTEATFCEKNILSCTISRTTCESGAAHEISSTNYLVFDLTNGAQLTQDDILYPEMLDSVAALLKQQVMLDKGIINESELYNELIFAENIRPNNNFMMDADGITFMFNPYEVADYAYGSVVVTLSYEQLKPFLREESPVAKLRKKN